MYKRNPLCSKVSMIWTLRVHKMNSQSKDHQIHQQATLTNFVQATLTNFVQATLINFVQATLINFVQATLTNSIFSGLIFDKVKD